jgi:hypothetical protein
LQPWPDASYQLRLAVRLLLAGLLAVVLVGTTAASTSAARGMKVGFYDEALTLEYPDDFGFRTLADLNADIVRMNLYWNRVAKSRPRNPSDPNDRAYDWRAYDRALERADRHGIEVMLSIIGTPRWANGGKASQYAPRRMRDLQAFATAAARRYRQVRLWMAWNEPNAPNFLKPQSVRRGGTWRFVSPERYALICNAVVTGVNRARKQNKVACGALNPRGKLEANGRRDSVSPLLFLTRMKRAGARPEVIAYHPYSPSPRISPTERIRSKTTVTLGVIDRLIAAVNRTYGRGMRIWITEYGYQTNPPDRHFGVSWKRQAQWMRVAFNRMRKNKRIDVALWFQLKDDSRLAGWQAGVISTDDVRKPSYAAFRRLAR